MQIEKDILKAQNSSIILPDLVIFGGTGDLALKKLIPSLYNLYRHSKTNLLDHFLNKIIIIGRQDLNTLEYIELAKANFLEQDNIKFDLKLWQDFINVISYLKMDINQQEEFSKLYNILNANMPDKPQNTTIYYLSTAPNLFNCICYNLAHYNLNHQNSRIVLEKPLGFDVESSNNINQFVLKFFKEQQIYRIDHYLGKESVQNLLAIRFGNTLFEALWRRQWISSIQITIAETIGVNSRGAFYDKTGALRDMLQNHLLQLLCMVAMEPPFDLNADTVRNEKLKVLQSLKPLTESDVLNNVVMGQYKSGIVDDKAVISYLNEDDIAIDSHTETFVALKAEIQNWRWAGVPFYLRTGKRLQERVAEIVIQFKDLPCKIFPFVSSSNQVNSMANRLIIRLQPDESIQLYFLSKKAGDTNELQPVFLDLNFNKVFNEETRMDGYERLLLDIIRGNLTLFVRQDEQEAAWKWVEPILNTWHKLNLAPKLYTAGSWGPSTASTLLSKDGFSWHEELI